MKKIIVLATVVTLFMLAGVGYAVEGQALAPAPSLGTDVDVTWVSKYIWRGIDKLDDVAAMQSSVNFDLYGTGFSFNVWSSLAASGGTMAGGGSRVNAEEWRYALTYGNSLYEGEVYKTNYATSYIFYDYPDMASNDADMQEFNIGLSWPDICPFGVVPGYTIISMWPSEGNGAVRKSAGFIHVLGLGYDYAVPGFLPNNPEQILSLGVAAVFNDGTVADTVDHDWSHVLWSVSTSIDCGRGTLKPALYYQTSMEDSVNPEDEFWVGVSYGMSF